MTTRISYGYYPILISYIIILREDGSEETNVYTKEELDEMIENWKTKRPPSRLGGPWVSSRDSSPLYGILIFVFLMAVVIPVIILFRKYTLCRSDEREIQAFDGDEAEIMFADPHALPKDPKLLPSLDAKEFEQMSV